MLLSEINRMRMFRAALALLKTTPAAILLILPVLTLLTSALEALVNAMLAAELTQGSVASGAGSTKNAKKLVLFNASSSVGKALLSFANNTGDTTLTKLMTDMLKNMDKIADATFVSRCKTILKKGQDNVGSLTPWGISAAVLTALDLMISSYEGQEANVRNLIVLRANATATIAVLQRETTALLKKQIDPVIGSLPDNSITHDFIIDYKRNRVIINVGHKYTQFKGVTINKETQEPISVDLEFKNSERSIKITSDGKYREVINPDMWDIIATKPGFEPFMLNGIKILAGEIKVENIEMKPL